MIQPRTVRWQPLAVFPLVCELSSLNAEALQQARLLFAPLLPSPESPVSCATSCWNVERAQNSDKWQVCRADTKAVFEARNISHALTYIEYSIVQELVELIKTESATNDAEESLFAMHGALLCKNGFGIVVVGPSESGKSTLTCALWQSGWTIASDDFCFVQGENQVFPAARRVSLRNGSRALLGEEMWTRIQNAPSSSPTREGQLFHPHEVDANNSTPQRNAIAIHAILFLKSIDDQRNMVKNDQPQPPESQARAVETNVVTANAIEANTGRNPVVQARFYHAARAAIALLPYCTLLPRGADANDANANRVLDWGSALPKIAPLMSRVPFYTLERGELAQMVAAVERLRNGV